MGNSLSMGGTGAIIKGAREINVRGKYEIIKKV